MTNRVPPLHPASPPPLHPASPPPFSKLHFYEDEVDENDDFGDYTIAKSDFREKFHQDLPETVENGEWIVQNGNVETISYDNTPSTFSVNTPPIDNVVLFEDSKKDSSILERTDDVCEKLTIDTKLSIGNVASTNVVEVEKTLIVTSTPTICDKVNSTSVFRVIKESEHPETDNNENELNLSADDGSTGTIENIVDKISDASSISQTKESVISESVKNHDSVAESSDDSSAIVNEAAFVVVENKSDIEEDIFDDGFQEFSDQKTDPVGEIVNENSNTSAPFKEVFGNEAKIDLFFSTTSKQVLDASAETLELPAEIEWPSSNIVTIDCSQNPESCQVGELCVVPEDDFADFVSPPTYEASSTEQLPHNNERNGVDTDVIETSSAEAHIFNMSAAECWSNIFKYKDEDRVEVNVNPLECKLNASSIWCRIKNIETTPALKFSWNDSEAKKLLLATLGIDSRNILFGPRWNSEVPRFASNLGFSPLVPEKASSNDNTKSQHSCPAVEEPVKSTNSESGPQSSNVRDAHFDWTDSGLTNPLDAHSHSTLLDLDLLANFDIHSPYYKEKRKPDKITKAPKTIKESENKPDAVVDSSTNRGLSAEATKILNNLPDLLVMEKQYIVFPTR